MSREESKLDGSGAPLDPPTGGAAALSPKRPKRGTSRTTLIALAIAVTLVVAALGTAFVLGAFKAQASNPGRSGTAGSTLNSVEISPSSASLGFSKLQEFSASAVNANGAEIASGVSFLWTLDPSTLGTLDVASGPEVSFTSASANVSGQISVVGTYGGISKSTTANIVVSYSSGFGGPSISSFDAVPSDIVLGGSTTLEVAASGGSPPLSYSYSALPSGCTTANTSALSCTPTVAGMFDPAVTVTDSLDHSVGATTSVDVSGRTTSVRGSLIFQPSGTNYSQSQPSGTGIVVASDGSTYRVLVPTSFSTAGSTVLAGSFQLTPDPTLLGYNDIVSLVPSSPVSTPSPNSEVNLSVDSVGVAIANLTLGISVSAGAPFAYLAFGTYPTFFSNVTFQGVDLNVSTLSSILNVNVAWLTGLADSVDPNLPTALSQVIVVNQSISLPDARDIVGQAQVIITPQNVSAFLASIAGTEGESSSADLAMVTLAMGYLDEELVAVAVVEPGSLSYWFLLAPIELNRSTLLGLVTLWVEPANLAVTLNGSVNPNATGLTSPVRAMVGVTWDQSPVAESGYSPTTVRELWSVTSDEAVTIQAVGIGISLEDAGTALTGMGYDEGQYLEDVASLANPAVYVLVDPSVVQNPNASLAYSSYAVAVIPNDELALQTSVSLFLTLNGVVYNTSYYLTGGCSSTNLPGCPLFVADSIEYGQAQKDLPYQLSRLTSATFVETTGFLAGTTMKTVDSDMGDYSELIQDSPIDVGVYDVGYSNGTEGFNLPAVYLTWGQGPTLEGTNNLTEGLYIPASTATAGWYLDNFDSFVGRVGWAPSVTAEFQSYTADVQDLIHDSVVNGSEPVPGVLFMMDLRANTSAGGVLASVSGGGTGGCISLVAVSLGSCIISNLTISANSASYIIPSTAAINTSILGSASGSGLLTGSCVWWGAVPSACSVGLMACLPGAFCSLNPYHVVTLTIYTCYEDLPSVEIVSCAAPLESLGAPGSVAVEYDLSWTGTFLEVTTSFQTALV
jgi:hypothetical protein